MCFFTLSLIKKCKNKWKMNGNTLQKYFVVMYNDNNIQNIFSQSGILYFFKWQILFWGVVLDLNKNLTVRTESSLILPLVLCTITPIIKACPHY